MKKALILIILISSACGGTLSDEQRKKARKDKEDHTLKKVSEAQITESAFTIGRNIAKLIETKTPGNLALVDSVQRVYQSKIVSLSLGNQSMKDIEKQIVDAYVSGSGKVELNDNVQKLGTDSILYTKPMTRELPDGSLQFTYAIGIKMPKRMLVLSIRD